MKKFILGCLASLALVACTPSKTTEPVDSTTAEVEVVDTVTVDTVDTTTVQ